MSYNIDSVETPVFDAWMYAKDVVELHKKYSNKFPEIEFISDLLSIATDHLINGTPAAQVDLDSLSWCGEGSGHSFELFKETIAPKIHGRVDGVFTWEGGDSFSGLRITDGVVEECDVIMTLKSRK